MESELLKPLIATKSRITLARKEIYLLFAKSSSPLLPSNIIEKVKVNKTTVYREIAFLLNNNLINEVSFGDSQIRYESVLLGHHHHLVCLKCKKIDNTNFDKGLSEIEKKIGFYNKFFVTKHNLEFFGYCKDCQN